MNNLSRAALIAGISVLVQAANAQASFTLESAYYTLDSSGPFNFNFIPNNVAETVDFIPTAPAFKVGDSTTFGSGVGTIIYNVTAVNPINGIDMVIQGDTELWGEVNWTETVEVGTNVIGIMNGSHKGSMYTGGVDGAFTQTAHLSFNSPVTSFKVKKTFDIDIAANRPPSTSVAAVSLIEQNLSPVPEPASVAALAIGITALIAKRRKK